MSANHETEELDAIFEALANRHRREIVYVLGLHPCSISQLADMRGLSLPAIHKHIAVLERADLVSRRKLGRSNFLTLNRDYEDRTTESRLVSAEVYGALTRSRSHYIPHSCSPLSPFLEKIPVGP